MKRLVPVLATLLVPAALAAAEEDRADLVRFLHPHLVSPRPEERLAALQVAAAAPSPALGAEALADYQDKPGIDYDEAGVLARVLAVLAPDRLCDLLLHGGEPIARCAAGSLAALPADQLLAMAKGFPADDQGSIRRRWLLDAAMRTDPHRPGYAQLASARFEGESVAARAERIAHLPAQQLTESEARAVLADAAPEPKVALARRIRYSYSSHQAWQLDVMVMLMASGQPPEARVAAYEDLGYEYRSWSGCRNAGEPAAMLAGIDDPDTRIRSASLFWLGENRQPVPEDKLLALLSDAQRDVRRNAAGAAQAPLSPVVRTRLEEMAADAKDCEIGLAALERIDRKLACDTAGAIGASATATKHTQLACLQLLARCEDARTDQLAAKLLACTDASIREVAVDVLQKRGQVDAVSSYMAAHASVASGSDRRQLLERLIGLDPDQRLAEMEAIFARQDIDTKVSFLGMCGRDASGFATTFVVRHIADANPEVAIAAISAVPWNFVRQPGFGEMMARILDKDRRIAEAAQKKIYETYIPSLKTLTSAAMRKTGISPPLYEGDQEMDQAAAGGSAQQQVAALGAAPEAELPDRILQLARLDDPQVGPALQRLMGDPRPTVSMAARLGLLLHGDESDQTIDLAILLLAGSSADTREFLTLPPITPRVLERVAAVGLPPAAQADVTRWLQARLQRLSAVAARPGPPPVHDGNSPVDPQADLRTPGIGQRTGLVDLAWTGASTVSVWDPADISHPTGGVLRVTCSQGNPHDRCSAAIDFPVGLAIRAVRVVARVRTGSRIGVGVGLGTGQDQDNYIANPQAVPADGKPHELIYDVHMPIFRCRADWHADVPYPSERPVARLMLQIYNQNAAAELDVSEITMLESLP